MADHQVEPLLHEVWPLQREAGHILVLYWCSFRMWNVVSICRVTYVDAV